MGSSAQIEMVSKILQSFVELQYKLLRKIINASHSKRFQLPP